MPRRKRHKPSPSTVTSPAGSPPWKNGDDGSFGSWLRKQREVRKLSLREVSDATKIGMRYLEALEEDRFEVLPATIFAKGFLRNYAQYVGLDADEVVNYYLVADRERLAAEEGEDEDLSPGSTAQPPITVIVWVVALVAVTLLVVYLLRSRGGEDKVEVVSPSTSLSSNSQGVEGDPLPRRAVDLNEGSTASGAGQATATLTEPAAPAESEPQIPLRVVLSFTGDCWVEARVDGRRRFSELRVQGESVQFDADETVDLVLGDVQAVRVEVNGQPFNGLAGEQGRIETTLKASDFVEPDSAESLSLAGSGTFTPASSRTETGRPRVVAGAHE